MKLETSNLAQRWTAVSTNEKNSKLGQKGSCGGHVTHFWYFGTPLICPERLKLETSNLAQEWMAERTNEKNAKLGQKGSCGGHVTHFRNFGTPNISGRNKATNLKFGSEMDDSVY